MLSAAPVGICAVPPSPAAGTHMSGTTLPRSVPMSDSAAAACTSASSSERTPGNPEPRSANIASVPRSEAAALAAGRPPSTEYADGAATGGSSVALAAIASDVAADMRNVSSPVASSLAGKYTDTSGVGIGRPEKMSMQLLAGSPSCALPATCGTVTCRSGQRRR
eukprot:356036-Chlamydomonas_euryale.AAC.2